MPYFRPKILKPSNVIEYARNNKTINTTIIPLLIYNANTVFFYVQAKIYI